MAPDALRSIVVGPGLRIGSIPARTGESAESESEVCPEPCTIGLPSGTGDPSGASRDGTIMILTGDIGGTNTRLALAELHGPRPTVRDVEIFASDSAAGMDEHIRRYREKHDEPIEAAAFGIAGPIIDGRCEATNLPWKIDSATLAKSLGLSEVGLINDLEAAAWGIATLDSDDVITINPGTPAEGNRAIVSAGTGLGEAGLFWNGRRHIPFATEGGHTDFAARNELEFELLQHLTARFGRVSYERVVSGPGVVNIYGFLRDCKGMTEVPLVIDRTEAGEIDGRTITEAGLAGESELCVRTLKLFLSIYGAEVGNVGLGMLARGGIWLGGGIIAAIAPQLSDFDDFLDAFRAKGRLSPTVADIPVHAIRDGLLALRGCATYALWRAREFD